MTGKDCADLLQLPYRVVLSLLRDGSISAVKVKEKWDVSEETVKTIKEEQRCKVEKIKGQYIKLYSEGASICGLQSRAVDDFTASGILHKPSQNFVETIIYGFLMNKKRATPEAGIFESGK